MDSKRETTPLHPDKLTITIVIPTYNRSGLMQRAVDSVLQQTWPHWKLVVLDNASADDTPEVMAALSRSDGRIRYHRHPENIGMLANWEFALKQVDTEHFSLLCDDDYLLPDFFEAAAREMMRHPELGLCFGTTNIVDEEGKKISIAPNPMKTGYYPAGAGAVAMMTLQHPATPAILFRTECFRAVGGFDRRSLFVADLDMILRVAFKYPVKYFEEESACYVVHANNSFKDVSGWHPGLLNLVRNLKQQQADPLYLYPVFQSFSKHAVVPLFAQFLRGPVGSFNQGILLSACRCTIEMHLVSNSLFGLMATFIRRVGSVIGWRLKLLRQVIGGVGLAVGGILDSVLKVIGVLLTGYSQPGSQVPDTGNNSIKATSRLLGSLYWIGLITFLIVYGLVEFLMMNILIRPLTKVYGVLARLRRPPLRPD